MKYAFIIYPLLCILISCEYENAQIDMKPEMIHYMRDIQPIIKSRCAITGCHVQGATMGDLSSYIRVRKFIDNGKFQKMVFDLKLMPPSTSLPLAFDEFNSLKYWVEEGGNDN